MKKNLLALLALLTVFNVAMIGPVHADKGACIQSSDSFTDEEFEDVYGGD